MFGAGAKIYKAGLEEAATQRDLDPIVVSSSWATALPAMYETVVHHSDVETERLLANALRSVLDHISSKVPHKQIVPIGTTPMFDLALPRCFARETKLGTSGTCAERVPTYHHWGPVADRIIAKMAGADITVVLPRQAFCRGSFYETRLNGNILYYEDNYLSFGGSKVARPLIMAALRKQI